MLAVVIPESDEYQLPMFLYIKLENEFNVYHDFGNLNFVVTPNLEWYTDGAVICRGR